MQRSQTAVDAMLDSENGGSCGARLCNAFNRAGYDIINDAINSSSTSTVGDGLGARYILGVEPLARRLGIIQNKYRIKNLSAIEGKYGIIYFENFHIDLWRADALIGNRYVLESVPFRYTRRAMWFMELGE